MSTYKEIQDQIKQLQKQAEELRKKEIGSAINQIKSIMDEYGITIADLGKAGKKTIREKKTISPKYRNPETGETWSGRGKPPKWIDKKNKDKYLIK